MAGVLVARQMHGGLVERRGNHGVDRACRGQVAGVEDVVDGGRAGGGALLPDRDALEGAFSRSRNVTCPGR